MNQSFFQQIVCEHIYIFFYKSKSLDDFQINPCISILVKRIQISRCLSNASRSLVVCHIRLEMLVKEIQVLWCLSNVSMSLYACQRNLSKYCDACRRNLRLEMLVKQGTALLRKTLSVQRIRIVTSHQTLNFNNVLLNIHRRKWFYPVLHHILVIQPVVCNLSGPLT